MSYVLGSVGFVLLFIYDFKQVRWGKKILTLNFGLGFCLIALSVVFAAMGDIYLEELFQITGIAAAFFAAVCLFLLVYTLFFALPFHETYREDSGKPKLCKTGMYALCRHPGVLWLFAFLLFAAAALGSAGLLRQAFFLTAWNLAYVLFQDNVTFVRLFEEYPQYKKETPFLIPTMESAKASIKR